MSQMNREQKRLMKRQGQVDDDGNPVAGQRPTPGQRNAAAQQTRRRRTTPWGWLKEVRAELRKVAWPTREEVQRYSTVVLITLLVLIALIFALDYAFSEIAVFLFKSG